MGLAQARCFGGGSSFPRRLVSVCWQCWTGISHLLITFPFAKHLSQHLFCLLIEQGGTFCANSSFLELLIWTTAQTLLRLFASWAPPQIYIHSSQPSLPLLLLFACLTGYPHAVSSVSLCLQFIALVIKINSRSKLLALLYLVSSCHRCDWAENTDKFLWSVRQKFRLSHKWVCLRCCLPWLHCHSTFRRDQGVNFSRPCFPFKHMKHMSQEGKCVNSHLFLLVCRTSTWPLTTDSYTC